MREPCEFLVPPDAMIRVDARTGKETEIYDPPADLCSWALYQAERFRNAPPWLMREASPGHLWRPGDCETCPCHVPKV